MGGTFDRRRQGVVKSSPRASEAKTSAARDETDGLLRRLEATIARAGDDPEVLQAFERMAKLGVFARANWVHEAGDAWMSDPERMEASSSQSQEHRALASKCLGDVGLWKMSDAALNRSVAAYQAALGTFRAADPGRAIQCLARYLRAAAFASFSIVHILEQKEQLVWALDELEARGDLVDEREEFHLSLVEMVRRILNEQLYAPTREEIIEAFGLVRRALLSLVTQVAPPRYRMAVPWSELGFWLEPDHIDVWGQGECAPFLRHTGASDPTSLGLLAAERALEVDDGSFYPFGQGNWDQEARRRKERGSHERMRAVFQDALRGGGRSVQSFLKDDVTVVASASDRTFEAIVDFMRTSRGRDVAAITDRQELAAFGAAATPTVLVYRYLEDTDGDDRAQQVLLARLMERSPTVICARSSTADFRQALASGDQDALYRIGGAGIRLDLFFRLVNALVDGS